VAVTAGGTGLTVRAAAGVLRGTAGLAPSARHAEGGRRKLIGQGVAEVAGDVYLLDHQNLSTHVVNRVLANPNAPGIFIDRLI
jgi:hypothetical protein